MNFTWITFVYLILYIIRQSFELRLDFLNMGFIRKHSDSIPPHLNQEMTPEQYSKTIQYNLDNHFYLLAYRFINIPVHWFFITLGFQFLDTWIRSFQLNPYLTGLLFFGSFSLISMILDLPFNIYHDFVLEERYGFNRKTWKIFVTDLIKGLLLSGILGGSLIFLLLWIMSATGSYWWIPAAVTVIIFQILMLWLIPTFILPLFNKLTPLEGDFREKINQLAGKAEFPTRDVLTMDGSKRSGHSNAFFTGFGKAKRIVFFDTLVDQIGEKELLGVLAHEIGHYKLGHVKRRLLFSFLSVFGFFLLLAILKDFNLLYPSLGFRQPSNYAAIIIFSIVFQELLFPFRYLMNRLSRKHEFEADAFAVRLTGQPDGLVSALEKLHETNMSSPVNHPSYAAFHFSHPDLPERLNAIQQVPLDTE